MTSGQLISFVLYTVPCRKWPFRVESLRARKEKPEEIVLTSPMDPTL